MVTIFARQLAKALRDRDMSQNALSVYSGVDQSTLSKLLKGRRTNPGMDLVVPLARALRVSLDWLVLGLDAKDAPQLPPDEDALLAAYRSAASDDYRAAILETVQRLARVK